MGNQPSINGGNDDPRMAQADGRTAPPPPGSVPQGVYAPAGFPTKPGQQPHHHHHHQHHHHAPPPFGPPGVSNSLSYPESSAYDAQQQQQHLHHHQQHPQQVSSSSSSSQQSRMDADQQQQNQQQHPKVEGGWLDDDTVPTVFRWEHGGRQVYITGTFNGWSRQIPMHRSGNDFTYIHNLKRGKHAFKFIVDDEWRFAPDQPTVADIEGRINNFIDVTDFKAYTGDRDFEKEKAAAEYGCHGVAAAEASGDAGVGGAGVGGATAGAAPLVEGDEKESKDSSNRPDLDGEIFSQNIPDFDEYTKEPPPLPPHLRHIILNKPPQLQDTAALPVPQHVALNHLYCTAIRDNMMVLGITQRYKTKFVTTVYYSPCAST